MSKSMLIVLLTALWFCFTPTAWAQSCDDFNRPDSTVVEGWTEWTPGWAISGNELHNPTGVARITIDGSEQADGCVRVRARYGTGAPSLRHAGIVARFTSIADPDYIYATVQDNTMSGEFDTYYIYDGTTWVALGSGSFGTDPILELEYQGTEVKLRIDVDGDGQWDHDDLATVTITGPGTCGVKALDEIFFNDFCYGPACSDWSVGPRCESFDDTVPSTVIEDWTEQTGDWEHYGGGWLFSRAVPVDQFITRNGSYQADGCVEGRVANGGTSEPGYVGLVARYTAPGSRIMAAVRDTSGGGYFSAYTIWDGGTVVASATGFDFGSQPLLRLAYAGDAVMFQVDTDLDGAWDHVFPATVTNTGAGFTGIVAHERHAVGDWCFGPDCLAWGGDTVVDFDGVPDTHWAYGGDVNLGEYYPGLDFGPTATILEATVYGYPAGQYPHHSFDAVLDPGVSGEILVQVQPPTDHVGIWYTSSVNELVLEGYDSAGTMVASAVGPANIQENDYLQINAHGIDAVRIHTAGGGFTVDDFEWNSGAPTLGVTYDCVPTSGVVPFVTSMSVVLENLYLDQTRQMAAHIDVTLASGGFISNWQAGYTNIAPGSTFSTSWNTTIPALGTVIGTNTFQLIAEDVTPSPYNEPPYPPAGHEATDSCLIVGIAP
jgi:hypothetical protein